MKSKSYKIYVQYVQIKNIEVDSKVILNNRRIGKVIQLDKNLDAVIATIEINRKAYITMSSKFQIKTSSENRGLIEVRLSAGTKLIEPNEYFIQEQES